MSPWKCTALKIIPNAEECFGAFGNDTTLAATTTQNPLIKLIEGKFTHLHTISVYLKALPNSKLSQCYRLYTDRAFSSLRNPGSYSLDY